MQTSQRWISPFLPVYAALSLAGGIWIGQQVQGIWWQCDGSRLQPSPLWLLAPLPVLLWGMWHWRRRYALIPFVCLGFALLGIARYLMHPFYPCPPANALLHYHAASAYERPLTLEGVITGYPEQRSRYTRYRVRIDTLWQGEDQVPVQGTALVRSEKQGDFHYGDRIRIRGTPITPPSFRDFDYRRYLARKGVFTLVPHAELSLLATDQGQPFWSALYRWRAAASQVLDQLLPQPYAALANGMILGIESGIPRTLYEKFNLTGASHVIVISGSNIAIVSGILLGLFSRLLKRRRYLVTLFTMSGILLYALLVGADAAVMRAALMGILYVWAVHLQRQSTAMISLFVAGCIMLLLNPLTLWDVGFQLSFMATLGLILFNAPLKRRWDARLGHRLPGLVNALLAEGLLVTLAAQLTTMPLVVVYFGRLSLISFVVNLLIIPVQPPIMIAGGLATLVGFVWLPLARLIAWIPLASLWWTVLVVERMAAVPWGSLEVSAFGQLLATLYYALFALAFAWWLLRQEQQADTFVPPAWRPALSRAVALVALVAVPLWGGATWWAQQPDGRLHVYVLGHDGVADFVIFTPGGNRILLTAGQQPSAFDVQAALAQLPGGRAPLSMVILSRAQIEPPALRLPPLLVLSPTTTPLAEGTVIQLDGDVSLQLVHASQEANDSWLFALRYHAFSTWLPFENTQAAQQVLLDQPDLAPPVLLIAPFPRTGAWPAVALLQRAHPQITLLPRGVTYPPAVQRALAEFTQAVPIPARAIIEIESDGQQIRLFSYAYADDALGQ